MAKRKKKRTSPKLTTVQRPKDFLDLIAPGTVQFHTDHYIFGNTYRTVMMLRGYGRLIETKNAEGPAKLRQYSKQAESARAEEVNMCAPFH